MVLVLQRRHKKYKVRVVYITKASEKGEHEDVEKEPERGMPVNLCIGIQQQQEERSVSGGQKHT